MFLAFVLLASPLRGATDPEVVVAVDPWDVDDRAAPLPSAVDGHRTSFADLAGVADVAPRPNPTPMAMGYTDAAAGRGFSCALDGNGAAFCWGRGNDGQLGSGTFVAYDTDVQGVSTGRSFTAIGAGDSHACALEADGDVWCWGQGGSGQLGTGSYDARSLPAEVLGLRSYEELAVGWTHTCALGEDGVVDCWGDNYQGKLGDGTTTGSNTPVTVTGGHTFVELYAGRDFACGLADDGEIYCWGSGWGGQLGNGGLAFSSTPVQVTNPGVTWASLSGADLGNAHACALDTTGQAWCWGTDWYGKAGGSGDQTTPLAVHGVHTFDRIFSTGNLSCGTKDGVGETWCWGRNDNGMLGDGTTTQGSTAVLVSTGQALNDVAASEDHTCAVGADGTGYCYGSNGHGQIGTGDAVGSGLPLGVTGLSSISEVDAGAQGGCALEGEGDVWCWGVGSHNGDGTSDPAPTAVMVSGGHSFRAVAVGHSSACAIDTSDDLWCWGSQSLAVGDGSGSPQATPVLVASGVASVDLTDSTGCYVALDGTGYCWGQNWYGQLGDGTFTDRTTPTEVAGGHTWRQISAGSWLTCGVTTSDVGYCWGQNWWGGVGNGAFDDVAYNTPQAVTGGHSFDRIATGWESTACGITTAGAPLCWGRGDRGQMGNGTTNSSSSPTPVTTASTFSHIDVGLLQVCASLDTGDAYCWGGSDYGEGGALLSDLTTPSYQGFVVAGLGVGERTSCFVLGDTSAACQGAYGRGYLGEGTILQEPSPRFLPEMAPPDILVLGDTVVADISGTEVDEFTIELAAGDTVDLLALADPGTGLNPRIELYDPSGTFRQGYARTRFLPDTAGAIFGYPIDVTGSWRIDVFAENGETTGGYTLRTRSSGPAVGTYPYREFIVAQEEGGGTMTAPLDVFNFARGSTNYVLSATEPWVSFSPPGGTIVRSALLDGDTERTDAVAHDVTFDPSGLAQGTHTAELTVTPDDLWGLAHVIPVTARVYDASVEVLATNTGTVNWPVLLEPSGAVLVGDSWTVRRYDPDVVPSPVETTWDVRGGGHGTGISGLARMADGRLFASVLGGQKIVQLHDDGTVSGFVSFGEPVRNLVAVGVVLFASVGSEAGTALHRIDRFGNATSLGSHPSATAFASAIAYDASGGRILSADSGTQTIYALDLATSSWDPTPVTAVPGQTVWGFTVANSGLAYIGTFQGEEVDPVLQTVDLGTGALADVATAPDDVNGMALGNGEIYFATRAWGLARTPVPDSAQGTPVMATLGDTVTVTFNADGEQASVLVDLTAGDTVDLGAFTDTLGAILALDLRGFRPDGSELEIPTYPRVECGAIPCTTEVAQLFPAYVVEQTGSHELLVEPVGFVSPGTVEVRTRPAGQVIVTADRFGSYFDIETPLELLAAEGAGPVTDTVYVYNTGPGAADWTGDTGGEASLSLSPPSGTLPAGVSGAVAPRVTSGSQGVRATAPAVAGPSGALVLHPEDLIPGTEPAPGPALAPPPDAEPVAVEFDPAGLSVGFDEGATVSFSPVSDSWGLSEQRGVRIRVYDPAFTEITRVPTDWRGLQLTMGPDGDLFFLTSLGVIHRIDPGTGATTEFATVPADGATFIGLKAAADGTLYATDQLGPIYEISPAGAVTQIATDEPATTTHPLPDGRLIVAHGQGFDVIEGGVRTRLVDESGLKISAYNEADGWLYYQLGFSDLKRVQPTTGAIETVVSGLGVSILALDIGRSGRFYADVVTHLRIMEADGTLVDSIADYPASGFGLTLGEGVLYGSTRANPAYVWSLPVADGPPSPAPALALGDSVRGTIGAPGDARTYEMELTDGDVVDLAALKVTTGSPMLPSVEVRDSTGAVLAEGTSRRYWCDGGCDPFMGYALPAWVVPATGTYTLRVFDTRDATGDFVLRTRLAGDIVDEARGSDSRVIIPVLPGATGSDTTWIYNTAPNSASWTGGSSSGITLSPSAGTLPAGSPGGDPSGEPGPATLLPREGTVPGQPWPGPGASPQAVPPGALAVTITADAAGLPMDTVLLDGGDPFVGYGYDFSVDDDFAYGRSQGVQLRVYDPAYDVIATDFASRSWGVVQRPDGSLMVAADGGIWEVDPTDGSRTALVTDLSEWWGLAGLDLAPSGDLYAADQANERLLRIRPDLSHTPVLQGARAYDVSVAPDGEVWVAAEDALWRIPVGGPAASVVASGGDRILAVQHDPITETVLFSEGSVVRRYDPAGPSVSTVGDLGFVVYAIEVAGTGDIFLRSFWETHRMDPSDGSVDWEKLTPAPGAGLYLGEGELFSTGMRHQVDDDDRDWLAAYPVAESRAEPSSLPVAFRSAGGAAVPGDTLDAGVYIDMGPSGGRALGGFSGILRWDTAVVAAVSAGSGDFVGSPNVNVDSLDAGVVRFGGINASDGDNLGVVEVVDLRLVATGGLGAETVLSLDSLDVSATDFSELGDSLDVREGTVVVTPGTLSLAVRGDSGVGTDPAQPFHLRAYLSELAGGVGSMSGRVGFDPAVVTVDSITAGDYGGELQSNAEMQGDSGFVRVAAINPSPAEADSVTFATLWIRAVGAGGDTTALRWQPEELADATALADLSPFLTANTSLSLTVLAGLWGDPSGDDAVSALDALICLSAVVGRDVSMFEPGACDVAPDDGSTFVGTVTALDALAILSHVVARTLPVTFRVGVAR